MEKAQYFGQKRSYIQSNVLKKNIYPFLKTGAKGFYPLFYPSWIERFSGHVFNDEEIKNSKQAYNHILSRINKHKNIERKKTILSSLNERELMLFMREFFIMVESEVMEDKPNLQ